MAKLLFERGRKHDDVVYVHQAGLPLEPRKDYINGPLEHHRSVGEPQGHFLEPEGSAVARKSRLVVVFVPDGDLPKTPVAVKSSEELSSPSESMHSSTRGSGKAFNRR